MYVTDKTYTWIFRSLRLAVGACGCMIAESAMMAATQEATVVKYPNTFCALTKAECIATVCCVDGVQAVVSPEFVFSEVSRSPQHLSSRTSNYL
jgi:hypothetical protein